MGIYLPSGCQERAGDGGYGQSLVGMAKGSFCWSDWCWRSDHSGMKESPGGREIKRTKKMRDERKRKQIIEDKSMRMSRRQKEV